jgi:hypothetical protein
MRPIDAMLVPRLRFSCLVVAAAMSGTDLVAQTFIVDSQNGPGTNFTDLFTAVSAVPSGSTLHVRPGSYNAFANSGKSLTIIGQPSATGTFPTINGHALFPGPIISSVPAGGRFVLSGFQVSGPSMPAEFRVSGCAGPVLLEDLTCSFQNAFVMSITNCANVHAIRLTISAFVPTTATPGSPPLVVQDSAVEFMRLLVQGYRSAQSGVTATAGLAAARSRLVLVNPGVSGGVALVSNSLPGPAISLSACTLHAFGNAGVSGSGITGGTSTSGAGGTGVVLAQGSHARVRGFALAGGFGFPNGQPFTRDASSSVDQDAADVAPSALLAGDVRPGNTVRYTLHARPGAVAALFLGVDARFLMIPPLSLGALGLDPLAVITAAVPGSGRLEFPSLVPAGWPPDTVILAQFVVFNPANSQLAASNLFTATSR